MTQEPHELLATPPDARDVSAELAAPPRPKLPWLTLGLAGAVIAAGAFGGGVWYQKSNTPTQTPRAAGARQGRPGGYGQGGGQGQGGFGRNGGQGGGFTRGTVKNVDGGTVYLTDANGNTVKITTTDSTKVTLNTQGKVGDLQPGQSVVVMGTPDGSGGYAATQLTEGANPGAGGFPGGGRAPGAAPSGN